MMEWDVLEGSGQRRKDLIALPRQVRPVEDRPDRNVLHAGDSMLCVAKEQLPLAPVHGGGYTCVREQGYPSSSATRPAHQCLDSGQLGRWEKEMAGQGPDSKRRTLLQQDSLKKRILVAEHETLIRGAAVALLQRLQCLFMVLDGGLELLDVFGATLSERSLCLPVPLLALFGCGIYLWLG